VGGYRRSADRTLEVARPWRPDLVVYSTLQGSGLLIGSLLSVPVVEQGLGLTGGGLLMGTRSLAERMLDATRPACDRHGLGDGPVPQAAVMDMCPPSMAEPDRPPATLPANVRAPGWVPLSSLLPTCAAIVHHGGATTTMNALAAGLPQLVLPHGADQPMNAATVVRRGVGLTCPPPEAGASAVAGALRRLLDEQELRGAAEQVRCEVMAMPPPAEVVARLVELARPGRG
jgi:hypothetical protein